MRKTLTQGVSWGLGRRPFAERSKRVIPLLFVLECLIPVSVFKRVQMIIFQTTQMFVV